MIDYGDSMKRNSVDANCKQSLETKVNNATNYFLYLTGGRDYRNIDRGSGLF